MAVILVVTKNTQSGQQEGVQPEWSYPLGLQAA